MPASQPNLFTSRLPAMQAADVDVLVRCLTGQGWVHAKELTRRHAISDRELRAIASASAGRVISGQRGYCLIEEATVDDANHAAAWLERQASLMAQRAREIRRAMHRRWVA